jgi:electron transport complex protein RnfE
MANTSTPLIKEFTKGLWAENPILRMVLGMCPTLAVTTTAINGFAMGMAVLFTLVMSSLIISLIRKLVPNEVRIATFIVVIATFVTVADRTIAAFWPDLSKAMGPFIPLIVVNCIVLARQEAFASKNPVGRAVLDALGMSVGFTLVLLVLASIREIIGSGSWFGMTIMPASYTSWMVMILPPGAFLTLGLLIALSNWINAKLEK